MPAMKILETTASGFPKNLQENIEAGEDGGILLDFIGNEEA
jgi:hypothetical protein